MIGGEAIRVMTRYGTWLDESMTAAELVVFFSFGGANVAGLASVSGAPVF